MQTYTVFYLECIGDIIAILSYTKII